MFSILSFESDFKRNVMLLKTIYPVVLVAMTMFYVETMAQDSFQSIWEATMNFYDKDYAAVTTLHTSKNGEKLTVLGPLGLEVLHASQGHRLSESPCVQSTGRGNRMPFGSTDAKGITLGSGKKAKSSPARTIFSDINLPIQLCSRLSLGKDAVLEGLNQS